MRRPSVQWLIAILVTLLSAVWQRTTGPTYPVRGTARLGGSEISYKLLRSHSINSRQPVAIAVDDAGATGTVEWRRYPTADPWQREPLRREGGVLRAALPPPPHPLMPPAGKLEYRVRLAGGGSETAFPAEPAVTRFKGDVAAAILIPHVIAMFFGMLFSTRAALAALFGGRPRLWGLLTVLLLVVGGFVLGPVVQKQAFGAYWTGIPWGWDLTDNKTLFAGAAWIAAAWRMTRHRNPRAAIVAAALVTLVVFAIPHSVWGSEAKWGR
jgi:hypothetical protein